MSSNWFTPLIWVWARSTFPYHPIILFNFYSAKVGFRPCEISASPLSSYWEFSLCGFWVQSRSAVSYHSHLVYQDVWFVDVFRGFPNYGRRMGSAAKQCRLSVNFPDRFLYAWVSFALSLFARQIVRISSSPGRYIYILFAFIAHCVAGGDF